MSKKLIAIAAAGALALSGLVATTSASALPVVDTAAGSSFVLVEAANSGSGTSASPFLDNVPVSGTVTSESATTSEVLRLSVSSTLKSRPVTITATAGIKLLDEAGNATNKYIASSGKDSLTLTTTSAGTTSFVAYATTTTTGVITISITDSSTPPVTDVTQVFVKGVAGAAYAIKSVTPPTSIQPDGKGTFVGVLVDAWGNTVETGTLTVNAIGGGSGTAVVSETDMTTASSMGWSSTTKRHGAVLTAGATAGQIAVSATLAGTPTTAQITAFGTPVRTYFTILTTASLAGQVTTLTAQVTALQAQITILTDQLAASRSVADSVTKKKYNALARKWNARNPGAKVALKK